MDSTIETAIEAWIMETEPLDKNAFAKRFVETTSKYRVWKGTKMPRLVQRQFKNGIAIIYGLDFDT
jgi:hypothetical protein